jgi:hypothetical protein
VGPSRSRAQAPSIGCGRLTRCAPSTDAREAAAHRGGCRSGARGGQLLPPPSWPYAGVGFEPAAILALDRGLTAGAEDSHVGRGSRGH